MDETKRIEIMREGLYAKIIHCKEFKDYLLSTGSKELVEYITWDDKDNNDFWGAKSEGRGKQPTIKGRNVLGKLLMELRDRAVKKTAEKKLLEEPKQDEPTFPDIKTLYTAKDYSDLSSITGVFQVTKRDDTCTKTEYPTNYKKALDIYNRFCDDLEKSENPCYANVTLNNNIIHCRLYETTVDIGELPF